MPEELRHSPKFQRWEALLRENGLDVHEIEEVYTRHNHKGDALFALLMLNATTPEGDKIPPICFLKGLVVSVLVCLIDEETGNRYNLLVKQRRIATGGYVYEQVAGMVDGGEVPHQIAVREVEEETGIKVKPQQVIALNQNPLYPSTGTSDEGLFFYYCEIPMSKEKILSYHANETGVEAENERIYTYVATFPEAMRLIENTNGILNIYMYQDAIGTNLMA